LFFGGFRRRRFSSKAFPGEKTKRRREISDGGQNTERRNRTNKGSENAERKKQRDLEPLAREREFPTTPAASEGIIAGNGKRLLTKASPKPKGEGVRKPKPDSFSDENPDGGGGSGDYRPEKLVRRRREKGFVTNPETPRGLFPEAFSESLFREPFLECFPGRFSFSGPRSIPWRALLKPLLGAFPARFGEKNVPKSFY
jgi:hypothetical protein